MNLSSWTGKRIFVTGATGFVGYWLTKRLVEEGAHLVVLVQDPDPQTPLYLTGLISQVALVNGSLECYATLLRALLQHEIDTVFHLGAQTLVGAAYQQPLLTFETNIRGTYQLLEACRLQGSISRILVASSDKAYGATAHLPYTEKMPVSGVFPYDVSKACTDLLAQSYAKTYDLPLTITRCGNIFGGADLNWSRLIPGTIRSLLHEETPLVRSDGTFVRDYVYVHDVVESYLLLAERATDPGIRAEAFNIGPERPYSVLEIIQQIQQLMDSALPPRILNQAKAEIHDQYLSCQKIEERLGWKPKYSLQEALRETIAWYRSYFSRKTAVRKGAKSWVSSSLP